MLGPRTKLEVWQIFLNIIVKCRALIEAEIQIMLKCSQDVHVFYLLCTASA